MKYAQQENQPAWYDEDDSKIYEKVNSGSSPFNEWYEFDDRADALELISKAFDSQSFHDRFCWFDGEIYDYDQFEEASMKEAGSSDDFKLIDGAKVAGLGEMIEAESRF